MVMFISAEAEFDTFSISNYYGVAQNYPAIDYMFKASENAGVAVKVSVTFRVGGLKL